MSHTPIPWRVAVHDTEGAVVRQVNTGQRVAEFAYYEDGEATVRAVNSRGQLLAALKVLVDTAWGLVSEPHQSFIAYMAVLKPALNQARAAIEEAEGEA